jgi:Flp pilus assembly protein CpaB
MSNPRGAYLALFLVLSAAAGAVYWGGAREATVVVARSDLGPGTRVTPDALLLRHVSAGAIPPGTAGAVDEVLGRYVAWPVLQGQFVPLRALARDRAALFEPYLPVPAGLHAISLAVTAADAVGGAIRPGDRVDVLAVPRNRPPGDPSTPATLLGSGVLVLGLRTDQGRLFDPDASGTHAFDLSSQRIGSILLAVPADDETRYAMASAGATFTLALDL